jgi:hypothetical protein
LYAAAVLSDCACIYLDVAPMILQMSRLSSNLTYDPSTPV